MPISKYWDERALRRLSTSEKQAEFTNNRIKKIYDKAYKNIQRELDSVYMNYSKTTGLDVQKLKELLTKKETDKVWKTLKRQGLDQYVMKNYKSRISRLEQIQAQIYAKAKQICTKEELEQRMCYKGVINDTYYKTVYDTQMGTGYAFGFSKLDNHTVNELLTERWSGKNYSERIWTNTDVLANQLSTIIGGALLSGQSIQKTSRQVRERFKVAKYYSNRLVRTEVNYFNNEIDAKAYEDMGVNKYVFVATLDARTSEICQSMDNKVFDYKKRQTGVNFPPMHPNCRSKTRGYLGKEIENKMKRKAINPITGKAEKIDNISYAQWQKKFVFNDNRNNFYPKNFRTEDSVDTLVNQIKLSNFEHKSASDVYDMFLQNNNENVSVIDVDTKTRLGDINTSNKNASVGFSDNQLKIMNNYNDRTLIAIHNHPGDGTFSPDDIYTLLRYQKLAGIMVVTNDYLYSLKPMFYQNTFSEEEITEFKTWFEKMLGKQYDELQDKYPYLSNNQIRHIGYYNTFKEIGWNYGREKRK